ncbi:HSP90 family protein [Desulfobacterales bacterium HSG2]|nr:HSP90 family protein [Desulfobacterales bacterium HSG2]
MSKNKNHRFQVNLRGIIDLLANHLYSSPRVYIRELLQNCADAITARRAVEPEHEGEIRVEITRDNDAVGLCVEDNGIGLTEADIHTFLSTIGASSKSDNVSEQRQTYIGQFGIGLLSCFMVSDEIVVITRSANPGGPSIEWRGKADGTYSLGSPGQDIGIGTQVCLRAKSEYEDLFSPDGLFRLISLFGGLLPFPIHLRYKSDEVCVNDASPPWRREWQTKAAEQRALLAYGKEVLGENFFDAIPLASEIGKVHGAAYVLPYKSAVGARQKHRVYLRNMLVSETVENILPDWAFFVRCIVNTDDLNPTASREGFYEDEKIDLVREILGREIREYLTDLADHEPQRLQNLIRLHFRSLKALASENPELLRVFGKWLPFETSLGEMTFDEIRKHGEHIRYVPQMDRFRQVAPIAAAQGMVVVNGGYGYDTQILELLPEVFKNIQVERFDADHIYHEFENLSFDEQDRVFPFLMEADRALREFGVRVELRKFNPVEMPALYLPDVTQEFLRSAERTIEEANVFFGSILQTATSEMRVKETNTVLCLNYQNRLVQKLSESPRGSKIGGIVQLLYAQALLL